MHVIYTFWISNGFEDGIGNDKISQMKIHISNMELRKTTFLLHLFSPFFFRISLAIYEMSRIHLEEVATALLWLHMSNMCVCVCDLKSSALMSSALACEHILLWEAPPVTITKTKLQWNSGILMECIHSPCMIGGPYHDDVIKWKHFPHYWPFVRGIHRSQVNSPHKGQWRGVLMFSLVLAWINGWVKNRESGDLRRHQANYDVIVMWWTVFKIKNYSFGDIAWDWHGAIRGEVRALMSGIKAQFWRKITQNKYHEIEMVNMFLCQRYYDISLSTLASTYCEND